MTCCKYPCKRHGKHSS